MAGNGAQTFSGTAAATERADTIAASGQVVHSGAIAVTEGPDTIAASGALSFSGQLAVTESPDSFTGTGEVEGVIFGALIVTERNDTAALGDPVAVTMASDRKFETEPTQRAFGEEPLTADRITPAKDRNFVTMASDRIFITEGKYYGGI
jgi:hypothetical protein